MMYTVMYLVTVMSLVSVFKQPKWQNLWFSPAGFARGVLRNAIKLAYTPTKTQRDKLYNARVNPIVSFPGQGVVLFGDKTALGFASAFDRINVRRLFLSIERVISGAAKSQLFEQNDESQRSLFLNIVEPFLRDVQGRRGVTDFLVKCDSDNNPPEAVDRGEFYAEVFVKTHKNNQLHHTDIRSNQNWCCIQRSSILIKTHNIQEGSFADL